MNKPKVHGTKYLWKHDFDKITKSIGPCTNEETAPIQLETVIHVYNDTFFKGLTFDYQLLNFIPISIS